MKKFILSHQQARANAIESVQNAPEGHEVRISEPRRTLDQGARFHALCDDLAGREWAGKPRDAAQWKVLLISGHAIATKLGAEMVPGLEGEFVNLRESTATMTKSRASSLLEYAEAFAATNFAEHAE